MLAVALLTGAASFIYEIGWIRMLSLVLGSSTHAFELMLSAFILGLAFGGLWIKRRIDQIAEPESFLGVVQVAMGLLALATLVVYGRSFELMEWLFSAAARTENGYSAFNFGSHLIALLVMFPPAFCAGMTLPLITHALLRRGSGEGAIGAVYSANTVGAIVGVFAAVHFAMPVLGLKGLITLGAGIDIALGLLLLWRVHAGGRLPAYATAAGLAAVGATLALVELDPYKMASGVYRHGVLLVPGRSQMLYHRDGKTATVNLMQFEGRLVSILTNGKSDAAVRLDLAGPVPRDETTMILTAALPLALHPQARTVANIGFGSGLTSHVLLASESLREVDSIEIEPAMVEAARGFSPRNDNVYRDPRSRIHIEDAKTFFSTHNKRYDIIASEPSNPWVSGTASLFTDEFYRRVTHHLNDRGLFVQWLQLYEITPALVASVFKALGRHFTDYVVYASYDFDIIIVARNGAELPPPSEAVFAQPELARELARLEIRNTAELELHRVGGKKALQPYFESFSIPANSDFFPVLDLNAAKARFMQVNAHEIVRLATTPIPAVEMLDGEHLRGGVAAADRPWLSRAVYAREALAARAYLLHGAASDLAQAPASLRSDLELVRLLALECPRGGGAVPIDRLFDVAAAMAPYLARDELRPVWDKFRTSPCFSRLGEPQRRWVALFAAVSERDAAKMAELAEMLLERNDASDAPRKDYLLAAAIIGRLTLGERERASALWRKFAGQVVSQRRNMLPDLLRGHMLAAGSGGAEGR
jgi:spermidine synthase